MMPGTIERIFSGRWIAGPSISDALREAKKAQRYGIIPIVNYLGEAYKDKKSVERTIRIYIKAIDVLKTRKLSFNISLKPSQLGILVGKDYCSKNYSRIVAYARKRGVFVWLDMEESSLVEDTIDLYERETRKGGVGICIQSYLKRSATDIDRITKTRGSVIRLVKGAYSAGTDIAYNDRKNVTANYYKLMDELFKRGHTFTIGTHDDKIIRKALSLNKIHKRDVTYAMLRGIRNDYLVRLAESGHKTSMYLPFGEEWISYSYRRLREAGHLSLLIRSLFGPSVKEL
jgi:Proline dehydrogenase